MVKRLNQCDIVTWRCRYHNKYRCNTTMVSRGNDIIIEPGNHCHQADVIQVKKYSLLSEVREMAVAGESTTRSIIGGAAPLATNCVLARLPKKSYQKMFSGKENSTRAEKCRYQLNLKTWCYAILGDLELVHRLPFENIWFCDGIFDMVPAMYYQLYTIHC